MIENVWKNDLRLKNMDVEKLNMLSEFADKIKQGKSSELLSMFVNMNSEASKRGVQFSDWETDVIISVLTSNMPESEKKKLDTLKLLAQKLSQKNR